MPTLERQDDVFILDLGDSENRFHPDWIDSVNAALDEVEHADGARALVTAATGKFFSNGLDLEWLRAHGDQFHGYVVAVHGLFARMLALPVITDRGGDRRCAGGQGRSDLGPDQVPEYARALDALRDKDTPLG